MTVAMRSGFLLVCGLMATVLSIECGPCAHAEVQESPAFTSSTQDGGQEKHQPATSPETTDAAASSSGTTLSRAGAVNPKVLTPITDKYHDANEAVSSQPSSLLLLANNERSDDATLPDAPVAQDQAQSAPQPPVSGPQINRLSVLPPRLTTYRLNAHDKLYIYLHETYGPPSVILPTIGAGFGMIRPRPAYPKDWKDGAGAFGRRYGDSLARNTSRSTAEVTTDILLHEDPRYLRSNSTGAFRRTFHAVAFSFFDKADSGKTTLAVSNFAGAAADGFVGMAYLPAGFNDLTHAGQRATAAMAEVAVRNMLVEFEPEWGPLYQKLHLPKILPTWWVPEHR